MQEAVERIPDLPADASETSGMLEQSSQGPGGLRPHQFV